LLRGGYPQDAATIGDCACWLSEQMFKRILIANRGEIAVRIIRACRELDIESVAVFSDADRASLHVREADFAVNIGAPPAVESYLKTERIIDAALQTCAEAVHPGYGFFSENAGFARAVEAAGLIFIGPPASAIERMGDKVAARRLMKAAGVPVVPGSPGTLENEDEVRAVANLIGYPIMLKAVAGGGGKGVRLVENDHDLASMVRRVANEAQSSFGDSRFYVEKFIKQPRHIEVQVFADSFGNTVHVFERECSIQRRHQKVVEESPSPFVNPVMRARMGEVAVKATRAVGYLGAGTIEFLADADKNFYFLEMNTRIQVEHPVTEMVSGLDLVKLQIRVAAGEPLPFVQEDLQQRGWALECRVYAEDPAAEFAPAPGKIQTMHLPDGPGIRVDEGVYAGAEVPIFYDPMICKLVAWGHDRDEAVARMRRALDEFTITGELVTNLDFHRWLVRHPRFLKGDFDTGFISQEYDGGGSGASHDSADSAHLAAILTAAFIASRHSNGAPSPSAAAPALTSAWKTLGRIDMLRR
jgi:acetyl-CoA carboxylase biotin carboxylase subunit